MSKASIWIIIAVGLAGCCIGFKEFVWFMAVGYGLAISAIAVTLCIMGIVTGAAGIPFLLMCAVLFIYGLRLGLFLLIREKKSDSYRKTLASTGSVTKMSLPISISMWIMCSVLYMMMTSPPYFRIENLSGGLAGSGNVCMWSGAVISALGVITEAVSDAQKSAQKKENPQMVATKGLFSLCRCPNYFGEITVWTGVLISGLPILRGFWQWFLAIIGYICIVAIMFSGAKRLELRQTKRCWKMKEYVDYANHTPLIIPFLPIYHMIDWRQ